MKIGIVGLGRMGAGMAERLRGGGYEVVGYDRNESLSDVGSLRDLVATLQPPRIVWVMVPSGDPTQGVIDELSELMEAGDILIDGGNSYYKDSKRRAKTLEQKDIRFVDAGTSGGIWGLSVGFNLMVGGPRSAFDLIEPLLATLAPPGGYAYLGSAGAGHYAKMVHNGIEYGMLEAYAEGFHLLESSEEDYDLAKVATLWNQGSVIRSWLLELAASAFEKDPSLDHLHGYVDDSGEGRWTVLEAIDRGISASVISEAVYARFTSRDENSFAMRVIAALRNEFGGHPIH